MGLYFRQTVMKNNSKHIFWTKIVIWLIVVSSIWYIGKMYFYDNNNLPQICSWKKCFTVELARTEAEQESGLMNRTYIPEKSGMLFIFPKNDLHVFWMKNTLIPLDMLWIDDHYKIVRILTAQPCISDPCTIYNPEFSASYVLEINAGVAAKYGIQEWDVMKFKNIDK